MIVNVENSTAVSIMWLKPEKPNGYVLEYQIVYYGFQPNVLSFIFLHNLTVFTLQVKVSTETSVIDGPHTFTLENETNTFVVISGLQSGLTYEFLVRVYLVQLKSIALLVAFNPFKIF